MTTDASSFLFGTVVLVCLFIVQIAALQYSSVFTFVFLYFAFMSVAAYWFEFRKDKIDMGEFAGMCGFTFILPLVSMAAVCSLVLMDFDDV